jgi:hypothetical protein
MKALRLVGLNLVLLLAAGCGGVEVGDEEGSTLVSQEAALDGGTSGGPTDAGVTDGGPTDAGIIDGGPTDAGTTDGGITDAGVADGGTGLSCPSSADVNGRAAAAWCCVSGHEPAGNNPLSSCVSDWCVSQCQSDCGGNPICYTFCYGACRNGVSCTCG